MDTFAITMWDFSWIERQWPGAGYEDWDMVLDELSERGYNAVRIDAFPHLVSEDKDKYWTLLPVWTVLDWGSPSKNRIQIQPALNQFIEKCNNRNIKVALSTWYRQDADNLRLNITTPDIMAKQWVKTIQTIEKANLLDNILFIDLCNEWPHPIWAPFFNNSPDGLGEEGWYTDASMQWMQEAAGLVKNSYPDLPVTFSFKSNKHLPQKDLSFLDLLEPHIWMSKCNDEEFYKIVGYNYPSNKPTGFDKMVELSENLYNSKKEYWQKLLVEEIQFTASVAIEKKIPLATTECWGVVDYKDWPLLNWEWVKELCELGTKTAIKTGAWKYIATSNFCGPQFTGMWRDVDWHREMTSLIKNKKIH